MARLRAQGLSTAMVLSIVVAIGNSADDKIDTGIQPIVPIVVVPRSTSDLYDDVWITYPKLADVRDEKSGLRLLEVRIYSPFKNDVRNPDYLVFSCLEQRYPKVGFHYYAGFGFSRGLYGRHVTIRFDKRDPSPSERWGRGEIRHADGNIRFHPEKRDEGWGFFDAVASSQFVHFRQTDLDRWKVRDLWIDAGYARPVLNEFKRRCLTYAPKSESEEVALNPKEQFRSERGQCDEKFEDWEKSQICTDAAKAALDAKESEFLDVITALRKYRLDLQD